MTCNCRQAFVNAWKQACTTPKSVFLVPIGRRYLVNATRFKGPCADKLIVQIDGTIIAPDEPKNWDPNYPRNWLDFSNLTGVLFQGGGVIDGSGSKWWAASCKKNKSNVIAKIHLLDFKFNQQIGFALIFYFFFGIPFVYFCILLLLIRFYLFLFGSLAKEHQP